MTAKSESSTVASVASLASPEITAKLPKYYAIIYTPRLEATSDQSPYMDQISCRSYCYAVTKGTKEKPLVSVETVPIREGVNFIDPKEWQAVIADNSHREEIEQLSSDYSRVFKILIPDSELARRSTIDFSNIRDAELLVENATDIDWLERCQLLESQNLRKPLAGQTEEKALLAHQSFLQKLSKRIETRKRELEAAQQKATSAGINAYV